MSWEELQDFVSREVYHNESMLVDELLNEGKFNYDDVENLHLTDEALKDDGYDEIEIIMIRDNGEDIQTVFEWWRVSDWLLEKLAKQGEPVLRTDYGDYWGRTCTGQAIALDHVIQEIHSELFKDIGQEKCGHIITKAEYVDKKLQGYRCNGCNELMPVNPQYKKAKK